MSQKCKVLIACVKWADLNPRRPLCPSSFTLIDTLQKSDIGVPYAFFCDEHAYKTKTQCDESFLNYCYQVQPDFLLLFPTQLDMSIALPSNDNRHQPLYAFPRNETIRFVRDKLSIPVITAVGDAWGNAAFERFEAMKDFSDKILLFDPASDFLIKTKTPQKYAILWFPVDQKIFYKTDLPQDIPISFIGRTHPVPENGSISAESSLHQYVYRTHLLQKMISLGCPIFQAGGVQSTYPLSVEMVANYLQRSKISISITYHTPTKRLFRGRTWEATNCGTMLLEEDNDSIRHFFEPLKHYVPFLDPEEGIDRANFFLHHEGFRMEIAKAAHELVQQEYNERNFWYKLLHLANV